MLNEIQRQKRHTIEVNGHFWVRIHVYLKNDAFHRPDLHSGKSLFNKNDLVGSLAIALLRPVFSFPVTLRDA